MRSLTSAALSAVLSETVARTVAVEMLFDSAPVRICGTPYPIIIGGNQFLGVGVLGKITQADEGADLQSYSMTVELSGIPRTLVATALTEPYQNRAATVWDVPLDPTSLQPISDPIIIFRGLMDTMTIALGTAATVTMSLTNRLADWERVRTRLFSDEEQQRLYPGDAGLAFAVGVENMEIVWPNSQWFIDNAKK